MRPAKSVLTLVAAVAALVIMTGGPSRADCASQSEANLVTAQNATEGVPGTEESTKDSAKMGEEEGTHTGSTMGATGEDDTDKIDQPARTNPTTGAVGGSMGDADTPAE
jgi:hypothetical protein